MISLIKRYFLLNDWFSYLLIASIMVFLYIVTVPPYVIFFMFFVALIVTPFYYEEKHSIHYFMISLPISKKRIVYSYFLYGFILAIFILAFQYMQMILTKYLLDGSYYIYHLKDIIILLCFAWITSSILILIYKFFRSFIKASIVLLVGLFMSTLFFLDFLIETLNMSEKVIFNEVNAGFSLLVEKYMPFSPYMSLVIVSLIILFISVKASERLYMRRTFDNIQKK